MDSDTAKLLVETVGNVLQATVGRPLVTLVQGLTDWRSITALGATVVALFFLLPVEKRDLGAAESLVHVLEQSGFALAGWVVAGVITAGAAFWILVLHLVHRRQGEKLSELRDGQDVERMSTLNEDVPRYAAKVANQGTQADR